MPHLLLFALTAVLALEACTRCIFIRKEGKLLQRSFKNLKYFTFQSNLLAGIVALADTVWLLKNGFLAVMPLGLSLLNFAAAAAVALTFLTVLFFLGPTMGCKGLFSGPNLELHLIVPILFAAAFLTAPNICELGFPATLAAAVPALLYGTCYALNLIVNGYGENNRNDWYGFGKGGPKTIPFAFLLIVGANWIMALLMWLIRR